jgi:hypothetical protein
MLASCFPSGWYDMEKLNYSLLFDTLTKNFCDPQTRTIPPHRIAADREETHRVLTNDFSVFKRHQIMARALLSSLANVPSISATAQTSANQAALACALERYRLANGQFPDSLAQLSPRFITNAPNDVITGQPYKYRRADDGQFILYSVGWNEKDDGGIPGDSLYDKDKGDWVWSYPVR